MALWSTLVVLLLALGVAVFSLGWMVIGGKNVYYQKSYASKVIQQDVLKTQPKYNCNVQGHGFMAGDIFYEIRNEENGPPSLCAQCRCTLKSVDCDGMKCDKVVDKTPLVYL